LSKNQFFYQRFFWTKIFVSPKSYKKHPKNKINIKVCTICIYNYLGIIHYSKKGYIGLIETFCDFFLDGNFFSKNDPYRGKVVRGIDCAHSRSVKTLSWPDSGKTVYLLKQKCKTSNFRRKTSWGFYRRRIDCAHFRGIKNFPELI